MEYSTFLMIKPDAIARDLDQEIKSFFVRQGYQIKRNKKVKVSKTLILAHYDEVIKRIGTSDFKKAVINEFYNQEVEIIELVSKDQDIIQRVREAIGATDPALAKRNTIRGIHGLDSLAKARAENRMLKNLIHASDSAENAAKELKLWFK
jgi:nucleoside-diphosphate kinase